MGEKLSDELKKKKANCTTVPKKQVKSVLKVPYSILRLPCKDFFYL